MSVTLTYLHQNATAQLSIDSPLGPLLLVRTAQGLAGVWFDGQAHHPGELAAPTLPADPLLRRAAQHLRRHFGGAVGTPFDAPLDLQGTPFQRRVWQALLQIDSGMTRSYGEIAAQVGTPNAARAVGAAVGRNPISVIVPCHRVLGAGGALTGYAGGLARKVALLEIERRSTRRASSTAPSSAELANAA